jgi:hypothetical protein
MSLYDEALVEAKKLKQIAEQDAKNAIIEDITPHIRKLIVSELAGKSNPLFEEEDKTLAGPADTTGSVDAGTTAGGIVAPGTPVSDNATVVGGPMDAPIKVAGADALNMPMPGADGKLVVDFDDLFVPAKPGEEESGDEGSGSAEASPEVPGGIPSPTPVDVSPSGSAAEPLPADPEAALEPESAMEETYALFAESLDRTAKKVHQAYSSKSGVPSLVKEALQDKLFQLLETLGNLSAKKLVSERLQKILENRLEILHCKLKEAVVTNTYLRTEGTDAMASKSLKEMAAKILAESETIPGGPVTSPADVHKTEKPMKVDNAEEAAADKAGTHAMKTTEPTVTLKTEVAALKALEEELKALVSEDSGSSLVAEPGKQNLAGAASSIPNKKVGEVDPTKTPAGGPTNSASHVQGVSENIEHSKDTGSEEEVDQSSTGHAVKKEVVAVSKKGLAEQTKKIKAEALRKQIVALHEKLKECGMSGDALPVPGMAGRQSVMGEDDVVVNFNFDLADLVPELGKLSDEDEIEISDDEEEDDDLSALGGIEVEDEGEDEEGLSVGGREEKKLPLTEAIKRGRGPATRKALNENKVLKAKLAQEELFNAKVVHLQPFLNNKNLTKEQKQRIVEHLDRGTTVDEVKVIYGRLKTVLENISKAKTKAGSSSKVGTPSGAKLNENVNQYEGAVLVEAERNRLMELAGIRRK